MLFILQLIHTASQISYLMNNIDKLANSAHNDAASMRSDNPAGGEDNEHNSDGCADIIQHYSKNPGHWECATPVVPPYLVMQYKD